MTFARDVIGGHSEITLLLLPEARGEAEKQVNQKEDKRKDLDGEFTWRTVNKGPEDDEVRQKASCVLNELHVTPLAVRNYCQAPTESALADLL